MQNPYDAFGRADLLPLRAEIIYSYERKFEGRILIYHMWKTGANAVKIYVEDISRTHWRHFWVMLNVDGIIKLHLTHKTSLIESLNKKGGFMTLRAE